MLVQDVMTPHPVTVRTGTTIKQALTLMARYRVTSLPVVNGAGRIQGVVSEADLIRDSVAPDARSAAPGADADVDSITPPRVVDEVLTRHAVTVEPHTDLAVAVDVMTSTSVKSLPVVDRHERVLGMVSRSDVVQLLARADSTLEHEIDQLLNQLGHADWLVEVREGVVEVNGPASHEDRSLAQVAVSTVPGVVGVRIT
ncbi:HPP family protein [Nocardioides ferulae]|uniref:CBS domain-containing protein n=1 Tax=Nocardioides ferulae TaxID=2340821 RepID=UPI000EAD727E|nr:CBS domain-containing protein [Nocardioides ferulae]